MLNVHQDQLVVEEKGIYSIENFLNARRLMYWQVYLHKTSVAAEKMMVALIQRAQFLVRTGVEVPCTKELNLFLTNPIETNDLVSDPNLLDAYCLIDDYDIWSGIKVWQHHRDKVLSSISRMFLNRHLFQIKLGLEPITIDFDLLRQRISTKFNLDHPEDVDFMIRQGVITNAAYTSGDSGISILTKQGDVVDIAEASDLPNIVALGKIVKKHYLTWPKSVTL